MAGGIFCCDSELLVVACGIQLPEQGSDPALGAWSLGHWTSRGVLFLIKFCFHVIVLVLNLYLKSTLDSSKSKPKQGTV